MMRATMQITANNTIRNLHKANNRYQNVVNQIATGQKVNKPSDDALATTEGLRITAVTTRLEQYNRNITNTGYSFLNLSETSLQNITGRMKDAKALVVESATETTTSSMRAANAMELASIMQEIVTLANAQESSRYLFGGTETQTTPYQIVGTSYVYYSGNSEAVKIQADTAAALQINSTGEEVFGSMTSILATGDMNPCLNIGNGFATKLSDLNGGSGVPAGSINIKMGSLSEKYPNGIVIDLSGCETLQDVAEKIEVDTLAAAKEAYDPYGKATGDDRYLARRYVKVELNAAGDGITLTETDEIWEATQDNPGKRPTDYPGFINDRDAYLTVAEVGGGTVAQALGIAGTAHYTADPLNVGKSIPQAIAGRDLDPVVSKNTLLADLANYSDKAFTITNGSLPSATGIIEVDDSANNFTDWYLAGLSKGANTGKSGELYVRVEETEAGNDDWRVNVYKSEKCTADSLVAQGEFKEGLVELREMNDSGLRGTVTMPPVAHASDIAPVTLQAQFDDSYSATISLSAYKAETHNLNSVDVIEEFRLRGMYPGGDPQNRSLEPCDYNGNFAMEVSQDADGQIRVDVYNNVSGPRSLVASGTLEKGVNAGIVTLTGVGKFTDIEGSVYVDWTKNIDYTQTPPEAKENSIKYDMTATFATVEDLMNAVDSSNTYTTAKISDDGNGVEIISHLAGAHLLVTEQVAQATHYNDYGQLGEIDLYTVMNGYNTDPTGKIFSNITTKKEDKTASVGGAALPIYTTTVSLYNCDPQAAEYDDEKSLVGTSTLQLAYDEAADKYYSYSSIANAWEEVTLPQKLNIQQSNHSGLTGTLELNSIRIPNGSSDTSCYYDTTAAAGQKNLTRAVVIDTREYQRNAVKSADGAGEPYAYLEQTNLKGVRTGVNTDADGNLTVTTGFRVADDEKNQLTNLNLKVGDGTSTDNGKLYAAVSYGVNGDDNNQVQQLNITKITRNLENPHLSDCSADGKIYVEIQGGTVKFYNHPTDRSDACHVADGSVSGNTVTINKVDYNGPLGDGTRSLAGSFTIPGALSDDMDIVIDLNAASVSLYSDAAKTSLVASGTSDADGNIELSEQNASGISGTVKIPLANGVTFDNDIVVDTTKLETIVYADSACTRPVAKGEIPNAAGGEVLLTALNNSGLTGSIIVNSVVETTDKYHQLQDVVLNDISVGEDTDANGCVYAEVTKIGDEWTVNLYSSNDPTGTVIATGVMNHNTGVVNLSGTGVTPPTGINGSLRLGNPPSWMPSEQTGAGSLITIEAGNQHTVTLNPATGLKNSGMKREDNLFATFTDTLAAMNNDDTDALHDLLDVFDQDDTRLLTARATIGTRVDRLEMLEERHVDEIFQFEKSYSNAIVLDYTEAAVRKQNAENIYNAAMTVYANIIQSSLVNFI